MQGIMKQVLLHFIWQCSPLPLLSSALMTCFSSVRRHDEKVIGNTVEFDLFKRPHTTRSTLSYLNCARWYERRVKSSCLNKSVGMAMILTAPSSSPSDTAKKSVNNRNWMGATLDCCFSADFWQYRTYEAAVCFFVLALWLLRPPPPMAICCSPPPPI